MKMTLRTTMTDQTTSQARPQVVFFGSGPVAAASLELLSQWCVIEAVITKPQPAHHKEKFPVIALAEKLGLPMRTAGNRRELDELMAGSVFQSRVAVLIDYGIIVSQKVIDSFPLGIINSHFSLLPEWRGADPISFSILSGQKETGVSLMLLVQKMDEGPLLAQATYDLPDNITTPQLTDDLIELSDKSLQEILPLYLAGNALPAPQRQIALPGHDVPSYSRKLTKADGVLDFTKPAAQLEREIRAYAEWPRSRMVLGGKDVIITRAYAVPSEPTSPQPGDIEADKDTGIIIIATSNGNLCIEKLKPAGKGEMDVRAFLAGNKL
jgi:methionyl-tRNA formyltransferase